MSTIQGLLFAALAFSWEKAPILMPFLKNLGLIIAVITLINVWLASTATQKLLNWHNEYNQNYQGPPVIGLYKNTSPHSIVQSLYKSRGVYYFSVYVLSPSAWIAISFIVVWLNLPNIDQPMPTDKPKDVAQIQLPISQIIREHHLIRALNLNKGD